MISEKHYPDFFARFYDVIYNQIRSETDLAYFINKIIEAGGPVLEIGVGTGRMFTEALKLGADIYGIDINQSMIDVLKQKTDPSSHHRVWVQDVTQMDLKKKFKLFIAPFRVFSHLIDIEQQFLALNAIYKHLAPGGKFIFDLYVPNLQMLDQGIKQQKDFEGEYEPGKKLTRIVNMHADQIRQISYITMQFTWEENGKEITESWDFELRFYFRFEIEHLIARSKLKLDAIYGDYKGNLLNKDSKEFVVVCSKR